MRRSLLLFVVLLAVWLAWSGHFTPFLITLGVVSCLLVTWLATRMGLVDKEGAPFEVSLRLLLYFPYLVVQIVKANIDVARRILDPRLPISPGVFVTKPLQRSGLGRVIYANSITLTPGTVSIAVERDAITVHALTREAQEDVLSDDMNRRVQKVEGRP